MKINYQVMINTGTNIGVIIEIETDLEELEESSLSEMLIDKGFLNSWCNDGEYSVIKRSLTITE